MDNKNEFSSMVNFIISAKEQCVEHDKVYTGICPECGGEVRFATSSYNGHVRIECHGECGMVIME